MTQDYKGFRRDRDVRLSGVGSKQSLLCSAPGSAVLGVSDP
jgi:hypothetical protein